MVDNNYFYTGAEINQYENGANIIYLRRSSTINSLEFRFLKFIEEINIIARQNRYKLNHLSDIRRFKTYYVNIFVSLLRNFYDQNTSSDIIINNLNDVTKKIIFNYSFFQDNDNHLERNSCDKAKGGYCDKANGGYRDKDIDIVIFDYTVFSLKSYTEIVDIKYKLCSRFSYNEIIINTSCIKIFNHLYTICSHYRSLFSSVILLELSEEIDFFLSNDVRNIRATLINNLRKEQTVLNSIANLIDIINKEIDYIGRNDND